MDERELYEKKRQAELDEWRAEIDKLKAKAEQASADAQLELDRRIGALERQVERGETMVEELAAAGEQKWEETRERIDSAWQSLVNEGRAAVEDVRGEEA